MSVFYRSFDERVDYFLGVTLSASSSSSCAREADPVHISMAPINSDSMLQRVFMVHLLGLEGKGRYTSSTHAIKLKVRTRALYVKTESTQAFPGQCIFPLSRPNPGYILGTSRIG